MLNTKEICDAKHIVLSVSSCKDIATIASANALYSYILTLHKKVSFYVQRSEASKELSFLPWMDKLRNSYPSSADLEIKLEDSSKVFDFFKNNKIKLNGKMATSLYAALLAETRGFSHGVDGMSFALASELVEAGADVKSCNRYIQNYNTLASLRLKAILLKKMILKDSAKMAYVDLEDSDLKCGGAVLEDIDTTIKDLLALPTVNIVIVKYKNKEMIYEGEKF